MLLPDSLGHDDVDEEIVSEEVGAPPAPDEQQRHGCHEPLRDPAAVGRWNLRVSCPGAEGGHGGEGKEHRHHPHHRHNGHHGLQWSFQSYQKNCY